MSHQEQQSMIKMPIAGGAYNQNKHNNYNSGVPQNSRYQQHQNVPYNQNQTNGQYNHHQHQQHQSPYNSHYNHQQQQHYLPPGGYAPRGKNFVARIQQHNNDDDTLSETSDEDDNYGGSGKSMGFGSGYQKVNTAGLCYIFLFFFFVFCFQS